VPTRPFHHGNLRAVLLEQAELMLRTGGIDGLSLRELARQAGVSHGAPRSHFIDRQALLDALAEQGFTQLTQDVRVALSGAGSVELRFRRVARAYIDFAVDNAALMELMSAAKRTAAAAPLHGAAPRLFQVLDEAMLPPPVERAGDDAADRFKLLFAAMVQGTATLIATRRVSESQIDPLINDVVKTLLESELGGQILRRPGLPPPV
jgi:AcrR family transcriptional regulator